MLLWDCACEQSYLCINSLYMFSERLSNKAAHLPYLSGYKTSFVPLEWLQITKLVLWNFAIIPILPFLNNFKDLDPSCKTDLDLWNCFGRKQKTPSYNRRNTVAIMGRMMIICYEVIYLIRILGMHVRDNNYLIAESMFYIVKVINNRF